MYYFLMEPSQLLVFSRWSFLTLSQIRCCCIFYHRRRRRRHCLLLLIKIHSQRMVFIRLQACLSYLFVSYLFRVLDMIRIPFLCYMCIRRIKSYLMVVTHAHHNLSLVIVLDTNCNNIAVLVNLENVYYPTATTTTTTSLLDA